MMNHKRVDEMVAMMSGKKLKKKKQYVPEEDMDAQDHLHPITSDGNQDNILQDIKDEDAKELEETPEEEIKEDPLSLDEPPMIADENEDEEDDDAPGIFKKHKMPSITIVINGSKKTV